jgi:hypothetical protein
MYLLLDSREKVSRVQKDQAQRHAPLHGRDRTLTASLLYELKSKRPVCTVGGLRLAGVI